MEQMKAADLKGMLVYVAESVIAEKEKLTELDRRIGDGDHGIGMERGMSAARKALEEMPAPEDIYLYFFAMGRAMLMNMGGASGVIFGTMFSAAAKDHTPAATLSPDAFAAAMTAGLNGVKERGKASVGDKTMVDAFQPACEAMQAHSGEGFAPMLEAAARAAREGAERTRDQQARFGRAKSLMERAMGNMDSGAASTAIIFHAMAVYAAGRSFS